MKNLSPSVIPRFILIEGSDGVGKSTLIGGLQDHLKRKKLPLSLVHEPGGTSLGLLLRKLLKGESFRLEENFVLSPGARQCLAAAENLASGELKRVISQIIGQSPGEINREFCIANISPLLEVYLFNAARSQLYDQQIAPAVGRGDWIISDRGFLSTIAYQGYGRGVDPELVEEICLGAMGTCMPDKIFYLQLSEDKRNARIDGRVGGKDRIESSGQEFFTQVENGFAQLSKLQKYPIKIVDAGNTPAEILSEVLGDLNLN